MSDICNNINFDSVAAMLCGEELTDEQKKDVEQFNQAYDEHIAKSEEE